MIDIIVSIIFSEKCVAFLLSAAAYISDGILLAIRVQGGVMYIELLLHVTFKEYKI